MIRKENRGFDREILKYLKGIMQSINKDYAASYILKKNMKYNYEKIEKKLSETKVELFKWFVKINIAQTSILIALMFALLEFFVK